MDTSLPFLTDESGKPKRYPLNDYYRTPNMERLAERGIRFNNFYAMSVCSPTRISIMTGQNAARHRTTNWINPDKNNGGPFGPPQWKWTGLEEGRRDAAGLTRVRGRGYENDPVGKGHFGPREYEGTEPMNTVRYQRGRFSIGAPPATTVEEHGNGQKQRAANAVPGLEKYHGTETFLTRPDHRAKARLSEAGRPRTVLSSISPTTPVHATRSTRTPRFAALYAIRTSRQSPRPLPP